MVDRLSINPKDQQSKLSFLKVLIQSLGEPAFIVSTSLEPALFYIEAVNPLLEKTLKRSAQELNRTPFQDLFQPMKSPLETCSADPFQLQLTYWDAQDQRLDIETHFTPFFEPNTSSGLWLVLLKGVDPKASLEQQSALIQVFHDLLANHTFRECNALFLKHILQSESCVYASLWWRPTYGATQDPLRQIASEGVSQVLSLDTEEILFRQLMLSDAPEPSLVLHHAEKGSVYAFPLYVANKVRGVLFLVSSSALTSAQFSLFSQTFGQILGVKIERKRLSEELTELFLYSPEPMMMSNLQGTVYQVNLALRQLLHYRDDTMPVLWDCIHIQDLPRFKRLYQKLQPGKESRFEGRCVNSLKEAIHVSWKMTFSPDNDLVYHVIRNTSQKHDLSERLEQAYTLARMGTWELDVQQELVYWSQVTRDIHEVDDPHFHPVFESGVDYYHPEDRAIIQAAVAKCMATGEHWDLQLRILTAKGNERWVRTVGEGEFLEGQCLHLFGVFIDIHAQKLAELAREQQARMLTLLNVLHQQFLEKNWEAVLPQAFQGFTDIFGIEFILFLHRRIMPEPSERLFLPTHIQPPSLKAEEDLLLLLDDLKPGEFTSSQVASLPDNDLRAYLKAFSLGEVRLLPMVLGRTQGIFVLGKCHVTCCTTEEEEDDNFSFVQTFAYSLSQAIARQESLDDLQTLNAELAENVNALAYSNQELEQFAYIASHDLQEPLRMVTSFLNQLEKKYKDVLDDRAQRYIYFATDGACRMRQIILDLLDYSRLGKPEQMVYEQLITKDLMQEVNVLLRQKIAETQAQVTWDLLPALSAPRMPLRHVLQNLVGNALKYMRPDTPPCIHITLTSVSDYWQFSVQDNGIGIDSDYFEKIFIIFQRLHGKEMYEGTGVGLALCKKIIDQCQGKIWVESTLGQGSTFYFRIPKGKA